MFKVLVFLFISFSVFADNFTVRDFGNSLLLKVRYPGLTSKTIKLNLIDNSENFKRYVSDDGKYSLVKEGEEFISYLAYKKTYLVLNSTSSQITRHISLSYNCPNILASYTKGLNKSIAANSIIELGLVYDKKYYDNYGGDTQLKILSIITSVDALYRAQLNIQIKPRFLITTPIVLTSTTPVEFLLELRDKHLDLASKADVVHLFTGSTDFNSLLGLTFVGATCQGDLFNYGFSARTISSLETIVTAHELGHSIGATHPEDSLVNPPDSLMTGVVSTATNFSDFSKNEINTLLPGDGCLTTRIFNDITFKKRIVTKRGKKYLEIFIQNTDLQKGTFHTLKIYYKNKSNFSRKIFSKRTHLNYVRETINLPKNADLSQITAYFR